MSQVAIVSAKRTAVGSFSGSLASVSADELGATVIRRLLADTKLRVDQVSEVILGQVRQLAKDKTLHARQQSTQASRRLAPQ